MYYNKKKKTHLKYSFQFVVILYYKINLIQNIFENYKF